MLCPLQPRLGTHPLEHLLLAGIEPYTTEWQRGALATIPLAEQPKTIYPPSLPNPTGGTRHITNFSKKELNRTPHPPSVGCSTGHTESYAAPVTHRPGQDL